MELSIIIPAYNEEARLGRMLDQYLPFFNERYAGCYEILVVVNGSRDRTEDVVREYARAHKPVRVIVDPRPIGKGGAVMLGFSQAQGRLVGFVDADGATPPEAFHELVKHIGAAGAIIASRWMPGADVQPPQPLSRRVASRIFNTMVRWMFGFKISDTQCGAKLMKGDALRKVRPDVGITQWAFDVDLLYQFKRHGFRIEEYPTRWHDVSGSKVDVVRASLEMTVALVRQRLIYSPFRFIVKLYDLTLGHWLKRH